MIWLLAIAAGLLLNEAVPALDRNPIPGSAWAMLAIGGVCLVGFIVGLLMGEGDD